MNLVSLLRLSLALYGKSDIDLELLGDGKGREERKRQQGALHLEARCGRVGVDRKDLRVGG